jgi:hypothetical protein
MLTRSLVVAAFVTGALVSHVLGKQEAPTAPAAPPVTCQFFQLTVHTSDAENPDLVLPPGYAPLGPMQSPYGGVGAGVIACTKP